jgi:hypothetical protein
VSSLVDVADVLRCPLCTRRGNTSIERAPELMPTCHHCGQRWWSLLLHVGTVPPQLDAIFGGVLTEAILITWPFPASLETPKYWRLLLSSRQYDEHARKPRVALVEAVVRLYHVRQHSETART